MLGFLSFACYKFILFSYPWPSLSLSLSPLALAGFCPLKSHYQTPHQSSSCRQPLSPIYSKPPVIPSPLSPFALKAQGMFDNCFFPLFSVFKNNFLFLRLKNLFGNSNGQKTKTVFKIQFVKETENIQKAVFSF